MVRDQHPELIMDYDKIVKSYQLHQAHLKALKSTLRPRGVWIVGAPGIGKSHCILETYGADNVYLKSQNKWWDGYLGQRVVLIDDFDFAGGVVLSHYLKRWSDRYGVTGEVKGSTINLNFEWLVITSNYTIADLFGPDGRENEKAAADKRTLVEALERRFTCYRASSRAGMDAIAGQVLDHIRSSNYKQEEG